MKKQRNSQFYKAIVVGLSTLFSASMFSFTAANADTATFVTPITGNPATVAGASDGTGVLVSPGATVGLLFSEAFALFDSNGSAINNDVSIFALSDFGSALATVRFGQYNNGTPNFVFTQQINPQPGGAEINLNFLAFVGCGAIGGCDFIEFTGVDNFGGSSVILDAIAFSDVSLLSVTSATPEPGMWALMLLGFFLVALRLKHARYAESSAYLLPAFPALPLSKQS